MAETAAKALQLGKGPGTDFLGVSFSTLDLIGHAYGPSSLEIQDELARLDGTIGQFLAQLDGAVGAMNYVVAFMADQGVAPIPEQATARGFDAGRRSCARPLSESGHRPRHGVRLRYARPADLSGPRRSPGRVLGRGDLSGHRTAERSIGACSSDFLPSC